MKQGGEVNQRDGGGEGEKDHPSCRPIGRSLKSNQNRTFYLYVKYISERRENEHKNFYVYLFFRVFSLSIDSLYLTLPSPLLPRQRPILMWPISFSSPERKIRGRVNI